MIIYIVGFFVIAWLSSLPSLYWLLGFPIIWAVFFYCARAFHLPLLAFMASCIISVSYGHTQLMHRLQPSDAASTWRVKGVVVGLPEQRSKHIKFYLHVNSIENSVQASPLHKPRLIRLSWYHADELFKPGDLLQLEVKLRPPHSLWNPGGFDYEQWALGRGIDAVGYVKKSSGHTPALGVSIDLWRFEFVSWLGSRFHDEPVVLSTLKALLLGDKSSLKDWQWSLLRNTGTTHLMVVSGLHIGICVAFGWWFGRAGAALMYGGRESTIPRHWFSVISALLLSGCYVAIAGFSVPTQRAWIMAAVLLGGQLVMRRPSVWFRWWLAMAIVLTLQPLAVHDIGFWLSFSAVATLLFLVTIRQHAMWPSLIKSQWWIGLALSPLMFLFFGQVSVSAPFINILAIPFLSVLLLMTIPSMLLEIIDVDWGIELISVLIQLLWAGLAWVDGVSEHWVVDLQAPSKLAFVFAACGVIMVLQPVSSKLKVLGVMCWLPMFSPPIKVIPEGRMSAVVFDVGQGSSVFIRTRGHSLLYDTGAAYPNGNTAFERSVLPYLKLQGIQLLDKLVVSHDDNDHAGGVTAVMKEMKIGVLESGMPNALQGDAQRCQTGVSWLWDSVEFRYIHPAPREGATDNDRSCVLEVRSNGCSLLITGDVSSRIEEEIVTSNTLPVHWLVAGHHGSKTSTGSVLLDAYQPESVIISAGFLNRYGHPHSSVVSRVREGESNIYRTDQQGAIILNETAEDECRVQTWRQKEKRYWTTN